METANGIGLPIAEEPFHSPCVQIVYTASRQVKSTARPEYAANRVFERCAALSFIRAGQKIAGSTFHYHLAVHLEPLPFRLSTVPTYAGIFPTDFSACQAVASREG